MMNRLPAREIEQLSAYLDKELAQRERALLEQRLKFEPALARALKELESVRASLRRAPQRKAPRNFTLTPAMLAGRQVAFVGWGSLNLISAAATVLLLVVLVGDFWAGGQLGFGPAAPAEGFPQALMAQEGAMKMAETATPEFEAEATEELQLFAAPLETDRAMEEQPAPYDLRVFIQDYALPVEIGLVVIAGLTAFVAWQLRRSKT
ncbi:MAG: hypothetical protein WEA61_03535 [Anaerolineales bacterium]